MLTLVGLLTIVAPVILHLGTKLLNLLGLQVAIIALLIPISFYTGIGLLALFVILLAVEFLQDQLLDRRYRQERHKKLKNTDWNKPARLLNSFRTLKLINQPYLISL